MFSYNWAVYFMSLVLVRVVLNIYFLCHMIYFDTVMWFLHHLQSPGVADITQVFGHGQCFYTIKLQSSVSLHVVEAPWLHLFTKKKKKQLRPICSWLLLKLNNTIYSLRMRRVCVSMLLFCFCVIFNISWLYEMHIIISGEECLTGFFLLKWSYTQYYNALCIFIISVIS